MQESLLYIQRIRALYDANIFSKSDMAIADYILEHPTCLSSTTASKLAEVSGTSPATVVRFCRKLGFSGLTEMKLSILHSPVDSSNALMDLQKTDTPLQIKQKVIGFTKSILDQLNELLDDDALEDAAQRISQAHRLYIMGEGGSGTICRAAYDIFLKLGIPCEFVSDSFFQTMVIETMDPSDVLLLIANSGRPLNMVQNACQARANGIQTIGIVGPANSPMAPYLDVEIRTSLFNSKYFSDLSAARTCELTVISVLHSIIALSSDEERLRRGRRVAKAMEQKYLEGPL